jgi:hypothetical protein
VRHEHWQGGIADDVTDDTTEQELAHAAVAVSPWREGEGEAAFRLPCQPSFGLLGMRAA